MISFFGPRAGIEEIFLDVPVWNIADHEARVAKLFSKSTRVSKIRGKCAEDGVISGSTIYEVTLLTKKPLYLFVSTDAGGNSPNSQSTVLQFALRNLERWKCSSIPSHLTYSHGTYVGEVANGKANGQGTYTASASGTVYKGSFVNDSFNGSGTMTWKDGAQYVGTWQNDVGVQGTMTYPNGKKASGTVRKGVFTPSN